MTQPRSKQSSKPEQLLYFDQDGDIWERISDTQVKRLRDGNVGAWQNGYGLQKYTGKLKKKKEVKSNV